MGYNRFMTTINLPIVSNKRECGTCTKCCEGWLTGDVRGHKMFPGKPCFFVEQGVGCKDYGNRPTNPCKTFSCGWKEVIEMPEHFKPETSGVIIKWANEGDTRFISIIKAPLDPTADLLSWVISYVTPYKFNLFWTIDHNSYWLGDENFCKLMKSKTNHGK
jgi:hypothetical protein